VQVALRDRDLDLRRSESPVDSDLRMVSPTTATDEELIGHAFVGSAGREGFGFRFLLGTIYSPETEREL
jgi:hypothetical protein